MWWVLLLALMLQADFVVAAPKVDTYEDAVVRIWNYGTDRKSNQPVRAHGTGFFINMAGYLLTNQHVIDDSSWSGPARYEVVYARDGKKEAATVVWSDKELDLALLLVDSGKAPAILKLEEPLIEKGTTVYAIGYPGVQDRVAGDNTKMMESTIVSGDVANRQKRKWYPNYSRQLSILGHTAEIHPGNSGGPLLNDCAHVVGVNTQGHYREVVGGDRVSAYKYASHISEAIRELRAQNIIMDLVAEVCEPGASDELNPMSFVNTAAIVMLAGLIALMFFKQSRQVVVQGVQKSIVRISSIGSSSRTSDTPHASQARSAPAPAGGMLLDRGPAAIRSTGAAAVQSGRVTLTPQNAAAGAMSFDLAHEGLSKQKHGISFGREVRIVDNLIQGEGISRRHFRLSFEQGNCFVEDLNSAGGTYVNTNKLQPYYAEGLKSGDTIAAGTCRWRVHLA